MSRVSNPAGSWLAGAQTGLQLRAQDIGVDQYDQRLAQDQSQHEDNLALASKRYGLDAEWNAFRIAEAEREFERAKTRGRFSLDLARSHLPQRGGLPMMTPKGPFFTPPGQADRLHSFLDYAADDPELAKAVSELVMSGAEKVQEFETWREAAKKSGADRFIPKDSPVWGMINAWDQSLTPKTLDVAMEQADQQIAQGLALELGEKAGIPKEQIALMTPAQVQAEASRRLSEQRRNEQDTKETAAKTEEAAAIDAAFVRYRAAIDSGQKPDPMDVAFLTRKNMLNEGPANVSGRSTVDVNKDPDVVVSKIDLDTAADIVRAKGVLATEEDHAELKAAGDRYRAAVKKAADTNRKSAAPSAAPAQAAPVADDATVAQVIKALAARLGREPTDDEIDAAMGAL